MFKDKLVVQNLDLDSRCPSGTQNKLIIIVSTCSETSFPSNSANEGINPTDDDPFVMSENEDVVVTDIDPSGA